ncbi:MAG: hypothetical protein ACJA1C_000357 [Crocinitomicaceae bacterium]|jgi:uncharacterized protein YfaS (alpha-2-macroglobulin family)
MKNHIYYSLSAIVFSLFLMSPSCEKNSTEPKETSESSSIVDNSIPKNNVPPLTFTFDEDYADAWKKVDSLQGLGLYASALDVVEEIYSFAKEEGNAPQVVKSVIYKMKYNSYLEEDDFVLAIAELNELAQNSEFPLKQIIHSVTAQTYWGYYEQNRWRIVNRTETVDFENKDIRTWDLSKISDEVSRHYMLSLTVSDSSQKANIQDFSEILSGYGNDLEQRPTLYDFLAHMALDFFKSSETELTRPENKFIVKGTSYFNTNATFLATSTDSEDARSNARKAVIILKELTRFHLNDKNPEARVDLNLKRLAFARNHSVEEAKEDLYIKALELLATQNKSHEVYSEIQFLSAKFYQGRGNAYDGTNEEFRWDKKKAIEICNDAIKSFPKSLGARQCEALKASIEFKALNFTTEDSYAPNSNGKMLISYTNIKKLYFKKVKVSWEYYMNQELHGTNHIEDLLKKPLVAEWTQELENPGDFQNHRTEILIEPKDFGQYVIIASYNKDFRLDSNAIATGSYWSTNLSYTYRRNENQTVDVIVTDRETGKPIKDVKGTVYIQKYNYTTRNDRLIKKESYRTDEFGMFTVKSQSDYRYFYVDLMHGADHYNNTSQVYQYRYNPRNEGRSTTNIFTDRAIYRPGQTIYFKGINLYHNKDVHTLEKNKKSTVEYYDNNSQKIASLDVTSNEYGTFSGSFTAPSGVLNGSMRIQTKTGVKYISVEEYKRPKFEVKFPPIEGVFKIGQDIKITGTGKAYAGSNIDGAEVNYRVVRSANFPSWSWYRWGYYPYSASIEVAHGETKTDENGEFIIEFKAKEDPSIKKSFYPTYSYQITADVTDVNGETHSSSQWVQVGYNCMNVSMPIPETLERNGNNEFPIRTTNLNGQDVGAKGTVKITRLIEPKGLFRTALWEKPDIQKFTKSDYQKLFPHDAYDEKVEVKDFKRGDEVYSTSFDTDKRDTVDFTSLKTWKPGRYVIDIESIDAFGEIVTETQYIRLIDTSEKTNPTNEIWSFIPLKVHCEPGENAEFIIYSAAKDLSVLYEIEHKGKIISKKLITLSSSQQKISIPILEKYRGNIMVHFTSVKYGRSHTSKSAIYVPYSNKDLKLEFETFRNKLLPGSKEEWKVKITGPKGEKVAAEMLATMYDASLDAFAANSIHMSVYNSNYSEKNWNSNCFTSKQSQLHRNYWNEYLSSPSRTYDQLNWWGYYNVGNVSTGTLYSIGGLGNISYSMNESESMDAPMEEPAAVMNGAFKLESEQKSYKSSNSRDKNDLDISGNYASGGGDISGGEGGKSLGTIKARTNMNETAFFYPQLETDANGAVIIKFTIPEALTKWKFLGMAHTQDLKIGYIQEEIVTQKELMVVPNAPRFFREGDKMTFTAKISNLAKEDLNGSAQLMLFDALSMKPIDSLFNIDSSIVPFSAKKGQSDAVSWNIEIPFGIGAVTYRVVAKSGNYTDGEEMAIPVLSNRMLVTESMPLPSRGIGTKNFTFDKLVNSGGSESIKHHKLTLEYTSNPAWYAVQAIPYMMEYPYECAEQTFTRYYSNALASNIVNSSPKIKRVFESWKESSPDAFLSNLEKNQELKSLMLEETPWVLDAKNESERKKRIALLFDLNKMDNQLSKAVRKLEKMQVSNGGWPWFPGMKESRYITQHIVTGMGHLDNLGVKNIREDRSVWSMAQNGVRYLDNRIVDDYNWAKTHDKNYLTEQHISNLQVQYLYARSYFKDVPMSKEVKIAFDYYQDQAATYWMKFNIYNEGMIALQAKRYEVDLIPEQIMASIKERAIQHEELGMYWKDNVRGYYWYQAPIETQALLIEAFDEVTNDQRSVEDMKVWLLKQKQTTDWKTTKATAEACYALLLRGTDILANDEQVEIKINGSVLDPEALGAKVEAGTGYFKTSWSGTEVEPEMGNVSITRTTEGVSWGAMYWQYFEDLDKITPHETPLKLSKKLFLVKNTDSGPVMSPITDETQLKPGDKVRVRIELRSDRDMEYVHLKDMRAAGFEPINVFSRYKYQDGLGYYESTKDAATNFFIEYLSKGTYVFEYDLRVSHFGDFSNGISTIQCMYAPEFTSHSEGIRVLVNEDE